MTKSIEFKYAKTGPFIIKKYLSKYEIRMKK